MSCALTQDYNLDCRDNYGGLRTVFIMEFDNATAITATAGVVSGITKATGKLFRKYNLIAHTRESEDNLTTNRENGSITVKQSVKFPINKMTVAVRNEIMLLAKNRLLIVVLDENGTGWLFGKEYGLMLATAVGKSGKALADRNGFELAMMAANTEIIHHQNSGTNRVVVQAFMRIVM